MPSYTLVPNCTIDDAPGILKTNISARWNTPWWRAYFPGQSFEEIYKISEPRMQGNLLLAQPIRRHQKVIIPETGEVVGYARWYMPESHTSEWAEAQLATVNDSDATKYQDIRTNTPLAYRKEMQAVFNKKADEMRGNLDPELSKNSMELNYLCVHPDHHRQGIANMLLKSGVDAANKLGLGVFAIVDNKESFDFLSKHEFKIVDDFVSDLKEWGLEGTRRDWMFVKHPSKK